MCVHCSCVQFRNRVENIAYFITLASCIHTHIRSSISRFPFHRIHLRFLFLSIATVLNCADATDCEYSCSWSVCVAALCVRREKCKCSNENDNGYDKDDSIITFWRYCLSVCLSVYLSICFRWMWYVSITALYIATRRAKSFEAKLLWFRIQFMDTLSVLFVSELDRCLCVCACKLLQKSTNCNICTDFHQHFPNYRLKRLRSVHCMPSMSFWLTFVTMKNETK